MYIQNSENYSEEELQKIRVYKNVSIQSCNIAEGVSIGDDSFIARCTLGSGTVLNRRNYLNDCILEGYTYTGIGTIMHNVEIGKFCSIAEYVMCGGKDHDYEKITTMPLFRFGQMLRKGEIPREKISPISEKCRIGNDVWIGAGATILHKATVGDGAIIGAGAVVVHDVPAYSIVVGNPARIIKMRFPDNIIADLLDIQWWKWPEKIILENINLLMGTQVDKNTILMMKNIERTQRGDNL